MAKIGKREPTYPVTIYFSEEEYKMLLDRKKKNGSSLNRTVKQCLAMANNPSSLKLLKEIENLQRRLKARELTLERLRKNRGKEYVDIEIELSDEEREALQNEADKEGLTLSNFIEEIISEGLAEKKEEKESNDSEEEKEEENK